MCLIKTKLSLNKLLSWLLIFRSLHSVRIEKFSSVGHARRFEVLSAVETLGSAQERGEEYLFV